MTPAGGPRRSSGGDGDDDGVVFDPVLVAGAMDHLTRQVDTLQATLDQVIDTITTEPAGGPWHWRTLSTEQAAALLDELRDFVGWLIDRYQLGSWRHTALPACWHAHPVAVEELTALMLAHRAAYNPRQRQPSDGPAAWHERWLWPTLRRLDDLGVFKGCGQGRHDDRRGPRAGSAGLGERLP